MAIESLVRPAIQQLKAYSSARSEFTGHAEIFLDANENALGSALGGQLHRYPDPLCTDIRERIAQRLDLLPETILVGNGSDEIIGMLITTFCEPTQDSILVTPPTFGMYEVAARVQSVGVIKVPLLSDFGLNVDAVIEQAVAAKVVFLCSPNNPTGNLIPHADLVRVIESVNALVVVDEAYIDFAGVASAANLIRKYDNVFVLRTFSKAWGLAGARIGIGVGTEKVVQFLRRVKMPYNVNSLSQDALRRALDKPDFVAAAIDSLNAERHRLAQFLTSLPIVATVYPSVTNFVLVRFFDGAAIFQALLQNGVVVRNQGAVQNCENCLRITVGTAQENDRIMAILKECV